MVFAARRWVGLACVLAAAGSGCGGGGGAGQSPSGTETPTFEFSQRYSYDRWVELAPETLDAGARLLDYAQFATDLVHRFAEPATAADVTAHCAREGRITMQLADRDGNGRASVGDSVTAVLDHCGVPILGLAATGTLRVDVVAASPQGVGVDHQARLVIVDALRLDPLFLGLAGTPSAAAGVLRGSLGSQWSETSTGMVLRAVSTPEDDLNFTTMHDGIESVDRMRRIDVLQTMRYDLATIGGSASFMYDVGTRGGTLRVSTPVAIEGDLGVAPRQMQVDIEIGLGQVMRLQPASGSSSLMVDMSYGPASGPPRTTRQQSWQGGMLRFARDVRDPSGVVNLLDKGSGSYWVASWRDTNAGSAIDWACSQDPFASTIPRADAVFQRPVLPPPALSEPGGMLRIQFRRAIAEDTPAYQFRFADDASPFDARYPAWPVPVTAVRRGSMYELSPTEPLRKARQYFLEGSENGSDWTSRRPILDAQGDIVVFGPLFATLRTESGLRAGIEYGDTATVNETAPARLQAVATLLAGQTTAAYQWQQISGPPVSLSSPQAASTEVRGGTAAREVGDVVLQVTVTDDRGQTDRARVVVTVGDRVSSGAVLYTEQGWGTVSSRRTATVGTGSIFQGPQAGVVSPRVSGPTEGGTGVDFSVRPADGGRLQPGSYASAVPVVAPGPAPGLISRVYCDTLPTSGSFDVLDVDYAPDGSITRLAIDFEQQCEVGGAYQRASYRFNSPLALRP